jgi:hypothetical protein
MGPRLLPSARHLLAGFSTARNSSDMKKSLIIPVLRFPDPGSAADVAKPLAAVPVGDTPVRPFATPRYPDAIARTYDAPQSGLQGGGHVTEGYLPHGPYLLYPWAQTPTAPTRRPPWWRPPSTSRSPKSMRSPPPIPPPSPPRRRTRSGFSTGWCPPKKTRRGT